MSVDANTRKRIDGFLKKLIAKGAGCEKLFHKLCREGCSSEDLAGLLFAVSTIAVGDSRGLLDLDELSMPQVRRLATDLRSLAGLVDRVNRTPLNPKRDLLAAPGDVNRDSARKHVARLYDMLPGMMRVYSFHLERFAKVSRALHKRRKYTHFETLRLLLYIEEGTGSPHYEDTSNLLTEGFLAAGGAEDKIPRFFTADALAKLKQRTAKFGLTSRFGNIAAPPSDKS